MVPLSLAAWLAGCFGVFYVTLAWTGEALGRLEARALAEAASRLEALWLTGVPPRRLLYGAAATAAVVGTLAALALHPLAGLLAAGSVMGVPFATLGVLEARRRAAFEAQLTDLLEGLAGSLRSGFALEQGLRLAAAQSPAPMRQELGLLLRETELGATLEEALGHLSVRMPGEDLALFVAAVALSREAGGSLAEVLGELAATMRRRREVEGRLRSLTAQGKLQAAVLGALPVALGAALYLIQPEMMRRFLSAPAGWALLALGAALEVLGLFWMRRILRPEV